MVGWWVIGCKGMVGDLGVVGKGMVGDWMVGQGEARWRRGDGG